MVTSLAQELLLEGRTEGKAEGRVEGRVEGRAEAVIRILRARFASLPVGVRNRVRGCGDPVLLDSWIDLAATCQSLAEFKRGLK
ncbi:MAG: hypothetical protein LBU23_06750 [Planctomycetota bacterium]|jgi:hypothetical protein|nr:hypothetical protein [Planctomycetota bacterium]